MWLNLYHRINPFVFHIYIISHTHFFCKFILSIRVYTFVIRSMNVVHTKWENALDKTTKILSLMTCSFHTGMVLFAFSAFGCTLPHFIFGNQLLHASNAFYGPSSLGTTSIMQSSVYNATMNTTATRTDTYVNLCKSDFNGNGTIGSGNICFLSRFLKF